MDSRTNFNSPSLLVAVSRPVFIYTAVVQLSYIVRAFVVVIRNILAFQVITQKKVLEVGL